MNGGIVAMYNYKFACKSGDFRSHKLCLFHFRSEIDYEERYYYLLATLTIILLKRRKTPLNSIVMPQKSIRATLLGELRNMSSLISQQQ